MILIWPNRDVIYRSGMHKVFPSNYFCWRRSGWSKFSESCSIPCLKMNLTRSLGPRELLRFASHVIAILVQLPDKWWKLCCRLMIGVSYTQGLAKMHLVDSVTTCHNSEQFVTCVPAFTDYLIMPIYPSYCMYF